MFSAYQQRRLERIEYEQGLAAMLKARRRMEYEQRLARQLEHEGYRLIKVKRRLTLSCRRCVWMRLWPFPYCYRLRHTQEHHSNHKENHVMKQTKEQLANHRRKVLAAKRLARFNSDGYDLIETERGLEVQCMTCGITWMRLSPARQEEHRSVCPPDAKLSRFMEPDPQPSAPPDPPASPLPLRRKPW